VADLFDMQDEIVARVARQLDTALAAAEARRAERSPHPDSMDLYFQGMVWFNKGLNPKDVNQAQTYLARALEIDPNNVDALVWMAFADGTLAGSFRGEEREARFAAAEAAAAKALSLAPNHAWGHVALGFVFGRTNRTERAIAECEQALAIDRNLATAQAFIGLHKLYLGRGEETEAYVKEALRLSPRDTWAFNWLAMVGYAKNSIGHCEEAVAWLRRSIDANPNHRMSHFQLASALARLGRSEEARAAARFGFAIDPQFTISAFRSSITNDNPTYVAQREHVIEGMRRAGVPEG
jgi:tetratricopeptide (TPR) repeat protein